MKMYKRILFILFVGTLISSSTINAQSKVEVIYLSDLKKMIGQNTDSVLVFNFWATWCAPCVKEISDFQQVEEEYAGQPVKFYYVSLDFISDLEKKLMPFINRRNLNNVYLLDELDYNIWIPQIDPKWEGNIPATLLVRPERKLRVFLDREVSAKELNLQIFALVNP